MIEACPDEADLYELNVIKQEKLFFTLLFYEWEGQTRLSLFAETVFPVPFLHCVESYALHRGDELFICQLNKGVYEKAKDSLLKGLSLSPANERTLMAWDGEPFMLDFLYVDQSWILEDRGSDKVGYWFQASQKQKKCENKRIKGQVPLTHCTTSIPASKNGHLACNPDVFMIKNIIHENSQTFIWRREKL